MESPFAGQHFVKNAAEAEDVRPDVDFLAFGLLRRHIGYGTQNCSRHGEPRGDISDSGIRIANDTFLGELGESEVEQFGLPVLGDHDVGGLQVAVHDAGGVGADQCAGDLNSILQHFAEAEPGARDKFFERFAFNEFHRDVIQAVFRTYIEDGDDIGMVERRRRLRLLDEALFAFFVAGLAGHQNLESDFAAEPGVFGAIHLTHPA